MEDIFLGFLNQSITAGWLILAVMALRMLLKRSPKWIHCLLWALVAFRLACPFSLESVFSLIPSRETVRHDMAVTSGPVIDSGVRFVDNAVNQVIRESAAPRPETSADPLQIWLFIASVIWIMGAAAMLLYALAAYTRLWLKIRTAVRLEEPVMLSEFVDTPFLFGVIRPRIYLPSDMPEELRAPVIAHELAHLQRRDNLWKILGYGMLAAYWFHPLCWAAYILLCRDIERACDEKVIRSYDMHQKKLYSEALLACSMDRRAGLVCPLAFGEVGVKERIRSVLNYKKPAFWGIAAAVAVCVVAAVCFLTDPVKEEGGSGGAVLAGADGGNGAGRGAGGTVDAGGADSGKEAANGGNRTGTDGTGSSGSGEDGRSGREGSENGAEASGTASGNGAEASGDGTRTLISAREADVVARFMRMDWDEIRSSHLPVVEEWAYWTDVVCIAEIPEEDIRIYGYNDTEINGRGVAVEIGDEVNYFDWNYVSMTSTHYQAPQCYWNRAKRQLQVALNIYMGPRANAQALHVLQYHDTGAPTDNELDAGWDANGWSGLLEERIDFRFEEETGQLTLFDTSNQRELASVTVEEGTVTWLELGNFSRFLLGEEIVLQFHPGYWVEGGFIAEYTEDIPLLEAELLYEDNGGAITFSLGEIRVAD